MLGDELDIYDDLDDFQQVEEQKSKELQASEQKYNDARAEITGLQAHNKALSKKIKTMEVNFQNLLDTAKAEIKRKDALITQLRKEKDDICFRRKRLNNSELAEPVALIERAHTSANDCSVRRERTTEHKCPPQEEKTAKPQGKSKEHSTDCKRTTSPGREDLSRLRAANSDVREHRRNRSPKRERSSSRRFSGRSRSRERRHSRERSSKNHPNTCHSRRNRSHSRQRIASMHDEREKRRRSKSRDPFSKDTCNNSKTPYNEMFKTLFGQTPTSEPRCQNKSSSLNAAVLHKLQNNEAPLTPMELYTPQQHKANSTEVCPTNNPENVDRYFVSNIPDAVAMPRTQVRNETQDIVIECSTSGDVVLVAESSNTDDTQACPSSSTTNMQIPGLELIHEARTVNAEPKSVNENESLTTLVDQNAQIVDLQSIKLINGEPDKPTMKNTNEECLTPLNSEEVYATGKKGVQLIEKDQTTVVKCIATTNTNTGQEHKSLDLKLTAKDNEKGLINTANTDLKNQVPQKITGIDYVNEELADKDPVRVPQAIEPFPDANIVTDTSKTKELHENASDDHGTSKPLTLNTLRSTTETPEDGFTGANDDLIGTPKRQLRAIKDIQIIEDIRLPLMMDIEHIAVQVDGLVSLVEEEESVAAESVKDVSGSKMVKGTTQVQSAELHATCENSREVNTAKSKDIKKEASEKHKVQSEPRKSRTAEASKTVLAEIIETNASEKNTTQKLTVDTGSEARLTDAVVMDKATIKQANVMYAQPDSTKMDHNDNSKCIGTLAVAVSAADKPYSPKQTSVNSNANLSLETDTVEQALKQLHHQSFEEPDETVVTSTSCKAQQTPKKNLIEILTQSPVGQKPPTPVKSVKKERSAERAAEIARHSPLKMKIKIKNVGARTSGDRQTTNKSPENCEMTPLKKRKVNLSDGAEVHEFGLQTPGSPNTVTLASHDLTHVTINETLNASSLDQADDNAMCDFDASQLSCVTKRCSLGNSDYQFERVNDEVILRVMRRGRRRRPRTDNSATSAEMTDPPINNCDKFLHSDR